MKYLMLSICVFGSLIFGIPEASAQVDHFTIDVYLDSADEDINAFASSLEIPDSWSVESLTLKDSDLIYWVQAPEVSLHENTIFSGIFPGGVRNLKNYSTPLLLFSLNIYGDFERIEAVNFSNSHVYLNHPMALEAEQSEFLYKIRDTETLSLTDISALADLDYDFMDDPVSGEHSLVLNSYRGALAAYSFEVKEGDFWFEDWFKINGVTALNGQSSTVSLFVTAPDGEQATLVLRQSLVRTGFIGLGILLCFGVVAYLFKLSLRVLRFNPLDALPKRAIHSMARSRDTTKVK